jgi:hypothetical protein
LGSDQDQFHSPQALVDELFMHALCRKPSDQEWQTIQELIGPSLDQTEMEDLLWSVVMLPEFQYVR